MDKHERERLIEEASTLGEVWFDSLDTFAGAYQEKGIGSAHCVMLVVWELLTKSLLTHKVQGKKLRGILMELEDEVDKEMGNQLELYPED